MRKGGLIAVYLAWDDAFLIWSGIQSRWNNQLTRPISGSTRLRTVYTCWHTTIIRDCLLEPSVSTSACTDCPKTRRSHLSLRTLLRISRIYERCIRSDQSKSSNVRRCEALFSFVSPRFASVINRQLIHRLFFPLGLRTFCKHSSTHTLQIMTL